ncbi:ATP-binding protein [Deinococcus radiotolerans]|uniref:SARP family transcriptional regulator n=1 Tax=Deinococcus radiotolerans TaxID=1309407 RepID=A0ABQ2FRG9_9DEIO|nr:AAA family ATPase [Deinococcus radiotolerans]GGL19639.1 SARP family transcriptional regulator [Deinococcus radiotolerans]
MPDAAWTLTLWGAPSLISPDGQRRPCGGKPLALLVYLAVEGRAARARTADLLWPEAGEAGRNNLVILLRRMSQRYGVPLVAPGAHLTLSDHMRVDACTGHRLERTLPLEDLDLPALDEFSTWLGDQRARLQAEGARAARLAARPLEDAGQFREAAPLLQRAAFLQPLSDETTRALMRAQYLSGDPVAALQTFEEFRRTVRATLQTEPMALTAALAREIEQGRRLAAPAVRREPSAAAPPRTVTGRDDLLHLMAQARHAGQSVVLTGEAGIGKSTLALADAAAQGDALIYAGRPSDGPVPYAAVTRSLRALLDRERHLHAHLSQWPVLGLLLPERLEAERSGTDAGPALRAAVTALYRVASSQVRTLILDDLHLMDRPSLDLCLSWLQDQALPVAVTACVRPEALPADVRGHLSELIRQPHVRHLPLAPISEAASATLLRHLGGPDLAGHAPLLHRFAGGNPLYLEETVRHLWTPGGTFDLRRLPDTGRAQQLITGRLDQLTPVARQLARAASVVGHDLQPAVLADMLGVPAPDIRTAWETLETAGLVLDGQFTHDLVREALLLHLPGPLRMLLHRAAARALTQHAAPPARVAQHWELGARPAEAAGALRQAGRAAQDTGLYREASQFLGRAAELLDAAHLAEPAFEALDQQLEALYVLEDQLPTWQRAVSALEGQARTTPQQGRAALHRARLHFARQEFGAQMQSAQQGLLLARQAQDLATELDLLEVVAGHALQHEYRAALPLLTHLESLAARLGRRDVQARALEGLGFAFQMTDPRRAGPALRAASQWHLDVSTPASAASAIAKWSRAAYRLGHFEAALAHAQRARHLLGDTEGFRVVALINAYGEALSRWGTGDPEGAAQLTDAALSQEAQTPAEQGWLSALRLVQLWLDLAQGSATPAALDEALALTDLPPTLHTEQLALQATLLSHLGQRGAAVELLDRLTRRAQHLGDTFVWLRTQLHQADLAGDPGARRALQDSAARRGLRGLTATPLAGRPDPILTVMLSRPK